MPPGRHDAIKEYTVLPVLQGEMRVSDDPNVVMTTILGSCVAACMWDDVLGIGGLNHFLLPGNDKSRSGVIGAGVHAMELLVNGLIRSGAERDRLKVKLLGGAKMRDGHIDIGEENAKFAKWFVENEGFELIDSCLGGRRGRSLRFWPVGGRIQRRFMEDARSVAQADQAQAPARPPRPEAADSGDVQLF